MRRGRVSMTWPDFTRNSVVVDGVCHKLTPKLAELAFLLIVRRGSYVPLPDVIEFMWPNPDEEPDFSEDVIRTYVSRLRRYLPEGSIIARATSYTDRMEAGHYLPGALMLTREPPLPEFRSSLFDCLPIQLKPQRAQPLGKTLPVRKALNKGVTRGERPKRVRLPVLPQRAFPWLTLPSSSSSSARRAAAS